MVCPRCLATFKEVAFNSIEWIPWWSGFIFCYYGFCYFQFHWMDSIHLNSMSTYQSLIRSFQFHWMDSMASVRAIVPVVLLTTFNSIEWILDSARCQGEGAGGRYRLSIPLNGFLGVLQWTTISSDINLSIPLNGFPTSFVVYADREPSTIFQFHWMDSSC